MRAFQLKTQRNITIVDLDDDNEEQDSKLEKKKEREENIEKDCTKEAEILEAASTANEESKENKTADDAEPMSVDTNTDDVAKTDADKPATEVESNKDKPDDIEMNEASKMLDSAQTEKSKDDSIADKKEENDTQKLQEPTLFELLNWLDNPPEDITFVSEFCITFEDFCDAVKVVQPSAKREGFITVPDVTWDDVGSLQDIREELKLAVLAPVKFPEKLARLGLSAPSGVLLCGPPGCGKTLLAKAIANEAGINFISVKGPELMNMV